MQVFNFNLNELTNFIEQTAKYQKVMLVFDNTVTNATIQDVYNAIKSICIFNKCHFNEVDEQIYNGYKAIIFMCGANAFLSLNLRLEEFNCAFVSMDGSLTCFLKYNSNKNCIFLNKNILDFPLVTSAVFNKLMDQLNNLSAGQNTVFNLPDLNSITCDGMLKFFNSANVNNFADLEIIKNEKLDYKFLPIIDYILIDALHLLFNNFLNNKIQYVDFYKSIKDEAKLIDKFYALSFNNTLKVAMEYNNASIKQMFKEIYFVLNKINYCLKISDNNLTEILKKLKNYTKNCTNLLANLYLYNIFGV